MRTLETKCDVYFKLSEVEDNSRHVYVGIGRTTGSKVVFRRVQNMYGYMAWVPLLVSSVRDISYTSIQEESIRDCIERYMANFRVDDKPEILQFEDFREYRTWLCNQEQW